MSIRIAWAVAVLFIAGRSPLYCQDIPRDTTSFTSAPGLELLENRYRHSIVLIKDIYEKLLSLDHHFTSLQTHSDIFQISNPHSYPEFEQMQDYLKENLRKKYQLELPDFLGQNALISGAFSILSLVLSDGSQSEKNKALDDVSCLLDFTMRVQGDLNVIYFETEFLREENVTLLSRCNDLFENTAMAVGYGQSIGECRGSDDWESLFEKVETAFKSLQYRASNGELVSEVDSREDDLRFQIDKTIQFMHEYASMVGQGVRHYQKFEKLIGHYQQEALCVERVPTAFSELQTDISATLEKFQNAYLLNEIEGSRYKALLYGMR